MGNRIKFRLALVTLGLLLSCSALSQATGEPSPQAKPIVQLLLLTQMDASIVMGPFGPDVAKPGDPELARQLKSLDDLIGPAIQASNGNASLQGAIKAYYVTAQAFFKNVHPQFGTPRTAAQENASRLKSGLDEKAAAVKLEAQLAGIQLGELPGV